MADWQTYVAKKRENKLEQIIDEEHLKDNETRRFIENSFRDGEIKTIGTDIDKLMPPVSRFDGGCEEKKQTVINKLRAFFEKFFGIGGEFKADDTVELYDMIDRGGLSMLAEDKTKIDVEENN